MRQIDAALSHTPGNRPHDDLKDFPQTMTNPKSLESQVQNENKDNSHVFHKKMPTDKSNESELENERKLSRKISKRKRHKDIKQECTFINGIFCNKCQKVFENKGEFEVHYKKAHNESPMYTCSLCYKTIEKYSSFRSHCYRHVTDQRYKCKECSKSFGLQTLLDVHVKAKHMQQKPFKCDACGKSFSTKPGLALHLKKHQEDVKEDFPCVECGKVLLTRGGLTTHLNAHRQGRRFMCDVCGKTFTQKINLQQHVKQHTGDKPYICDQCGNTFTDRTQLSRHYNRHSTKRPFKCEACGKMYKTERCLKVHKQVHGTERPYRCAYCNKGFLNKTKLKQHHNIHTGERPFACNFCERKFTNYPNWLKHTRRRHSEASNQKNATNKDQKAAHNISTSTNYKNEACAKSLDFSSTSNVNSSLNQIVQIPEFVPADYQTQGQVSSLNNHFLDDAQSIGDTLPDLLPHLEPSEAVHHDSLTTDFKLSKTDELYLQQNILNFPMTVSNENRLNVECSMSNLQVEGQFVSGFPELFEQCPSAAGHLQYDLVPLQYQYV